MSRLFWVMIVVVLGMSYSTGNTDISALQFNLSPEYHDTPKQSILTSNDLLNRFDPYELLEKEEQNELIEEDSESSYLPCSGAFIFSSNILLLKYLKAIVSSIVFTEFLSPQKLFVIFHCWKLHFLI